jgi:hypothetical protein
MDLCSHADCHFSRRACYYESMRGTVSAEMALRDSTGPPVIPLAIHTFLHCAKHQKELSLCHYDHACPQGYGQPATCYPCVIEAQMVACHVPQLPVLPVLLAQQCDALVKQDMVELTTPSQIALA